MASPSADSDGCSEARERSQADVAIRPIDAPTAPLARSCSKRSTRSTSPAAHASKIDMVAPRATSRFTISFWR